jgi:multidrug efflux pump subunit AcrA (membrane-fusion protein)
MKAHGFLALLVVVLFAPSLARGQVPPTTAKVETAALDLTPPDRYQIPSVLEPIRRVTILAPSDGVVRSMDAPIGATVREGQEMAQLDRTEAAARLKIAQANVKEMQALLKTSPAAAVVQAQLEAAQARTEIAQLELDRCTLRAPFAGRVFAAPISPGQYVTKGTLLAELVDTSSLHVLVPYDRAGVSVGGNVNVSIEGQTVSGKVQAMLPLGEEHAPLRGLSTSFTAVWVAIPNTKGTFEPGQRVLSPSLPTAPIATIPAHALHGEGKGAPKVQVIRNEYATDVAVRVLGHPGPDRVQVSGPLRRTDALIVSSTVPLVAGTLVRFSGSASGIEAMSPNPAESGEAAAITAPSGSARTASDSARGKTATRPTESPRTNTPARPASNATPF